MKIDVNKMEGLREAKGWTKKNLSIQSGVSDFTLISIRKGKDIREATAQCIADALGVKVEDLLLDDQPKPAPAPKAAPAPKPAPAPKAAPATKAEQASEPKQIPSTEMPDAITQTLEAVKDYGEHEYQRGRSEMCDLFLKAVREAIDRWTDANGEGGAR